MVRLIAAADVVAGARGVLEEQIPLVLMALGLDEPDVPGQKPFTAPHSWEQVPDITALQTANLPAGVIVPRGTVGEPRQSSLGIDTTWRFEVALFDRDRDFTPTAERLTRWAAVLRGALLLDRTLGGVATGLRWKAESYKPLSDVRGARTLGGCVVEFEADVRNVADLADLGPAVTSTQSSLTVS